MNLHSHTCIVCQRHFNSKATHANICSAECRKLRDKQFYHRQKLVRKPKPQSDNMKEYYAYCEKNGFVTYGNFKH